MRRHEDPPLRHEFLDLSSHERKEASRNQRQRVVRALESGLQLLCRGANEIYHRLACAYSHHAETSIDYVECTLGVKSLPPQMSLPQWHPCKSSPREERLSENPFEHGGQLCVGEK